MLILENLTYLHPNRDLLFDGLNLVIGSQSKIALIGNNGVGKSTLLKMIAGDLLPSHGVIHTESIPYYVPQHFGQFNELTVAGALGVDTKLIALRNILEGEVTDENLSILADDWSIEEQCEQALNHWGLGDLDLLQQMEALSGGQKTKVFLAGISIHKPKIVLLDEPSNHLDTKGRKLLENFIDTYSGTILLVSHDRTLLNLLDSVCELGKRGISQYGGNYDFYMDQKRIESQALNDDLKSKEKALKKAKMVEREAMERQQKLDARGKKKQLKAGVPTIMLNTLRNNAEKSTSRMKDVHDEKIGAITSELSELRSALPDRDKMKFGLNSSNLHQGKILVSAERINYGYSTQLLWKNSLDFQILSGERIALNGPNASGKSTLIHLMLGKLEPCKGEIYRAATNSVYIDQDYSLIDDARTVWAQVEVFNQSGLQEHEVKIRLNRFLFGKEYWDKSCSALSGGEKMRLMLCCLTIQNKAPDMLILDEPTNNLDIQNLEILTEAINEYKGTVLVVSHDAYFLKEIGIDRSINLI